MWTARKVEFWIRWRRHHIHVLIGSYQSWCILPWFVTFQLYDPLLEENSCCACCLWQHTCAQCTSGHVVCVFKLSRTDGDHSSYRMKRLAWMEILFLKKKKLFNYSKTIHKSLIFFLLKMLKLKLTFCWLNSSLHFIHNILEFRHRAAFT